MRQRVRSRKGRMVIIVTSILILFLYCTGGKNVWSKEEGKLLRLFVLPVGAAFSQEQGDGDLLLAEEENRGLVCMLAENEVGTTGFGEYKPDEGLTELAEAPEIMPEEPGTGGGAVSGSMDGSVQTAGGYRSPADGDAGTGASATDGGGSAGTAGSAGTGATAADGTGSAGSAGTGAAAADGTGSAGSAGTGAAATDGTGSAGSAGTGKSAGKTAGKQAGINRKKLSDYDYLYQTFYQVDSTTTIGKDQLNEESLLGKDLTLKKTKGDEPQILIYHTHSQETYKGCKEGEASTSVVGVGDYLAELLKADGYKVLHHKGEYDVEDRDHAYTYALPALEKLLEENPSIEVVIDIHRDSVPEQRHLVTEINGKPTAQIMFFNGMSHTTALGDIESLPNPNRAWNLAFSFQMQLAAAERYPGLTRRIYLKGYRYNMHLRKRSMLVEVGAQNNTFEEARNAMEPLSVLLNEVLSGKTAAR